MDLKQIFELMNQMEKSNLSKLELKDKDFSIKLEKETGDSVVKPMISTTEKPKNMVTDSKVITSPIVGTFYQSSGPDQAPFVEVGTTIQKGDVVCIIEAMKLFNEVQSDYSGTVKQILVKDGDLLEYGQPIMILE